METLRTKNALLEHLAANSQDLLRWSCNGGSVSGAGSWAVGVGATRREVDGRAANAVVKAGIVRQTGPVDSRFAEYKVRLFLLKAALKELAHAKSRLPNRSESPSM